MIEQKLESEPIMVSIHCLVYNHEPYIRQCLDGFVMQKTNFRFEAIVHDDASTDGSAAIIREYAEKYPDIIKPILETENQYSKKDGSLRKIMDAHMRGKYVAMCEGDDYWTDPNKLQMQVDYMEGHPDCSLCFHAHNNLDGNKYYLVRRYSNNLEECPVSDIILAGGGFMATNSMMYKKEILPRELPAWAKNLPIGDLPLMLRLAECGKVAYLDKAMSVYRICVPGSWTARKKSFNYQFRFIRRMNIMWRKYDQWTLYRHHKDVRKMRLENYFSIIMFTLAFLKRKLFYIFSR